MPKIRVETGNVRRSADNLQRHAQNFQTEYQQLVDHGRRLDGTWEGEARDKYMNQINQDMPKFEAMLQLLADYVRVLNETAGLYEQGEMQATNIAGR